LRGMLGPVKLSAGHWFLSIPRQRLWLRLLIIINFLGSLYGFYWYWDQLVVTPPALWIFVSDSPLSTFYFAALLATLLSGRRPGPFGGLAYMGLVKYGFWTIFIIGLFWITGGGFTWVDLMLFLSHLAMVIEACLFFRVHPASRVSLGAAMVWYLVNDYLDYFRGYHPTYPEANPEFGLVRAVSLASTWVVFLIFWTWSRSLSRSPDR
jgi:uncharacterized membrane protein YpjA